MQQTHLLKLLDGGLEAGVVEGLAGIQGCGHAVEPLRPPCAATPRRGSSQQRQRLCHISSVGVREALGWKSTKSSRTAQPWA